MCIGSEDPFIPADQGADFEAEMRLAGVDWRIELYGGVVQSFTHPLAAAAGFPGIAYDPAADRRSTRAMLDLFDEIFRPT